MSQGEAVGDLEVSVGYVLKQAQAALRAAMDEALGPVGLTVSQYSCLELLGQRPGLSGSELARGAFVSRQSMNQVLRGLEDRGLLARPPTAAHGRALPTELTSAGRAALRTASSAVAEIEQRMLAPLDGERRQRLCQDLAACAGALTEGRGGAGRDTEQDVAP
jgi:DNA-binding MarR family transcriptional regulator